MPTKAQKVIAARKVKQQEKSTTAEKKLILRNLQKHSAVKSLSILGARMKARSTEIAEALDLLDHANGFYIEVDKLAKGKAMLEVTPRTLQEANLIIADAKRIVIDDAYLRRTSEFVPAGDNPVYPDVVIAIRAVLQSLERFKTKREDAAKIDSDTVCELNTILTAIAMESEGVDVVSKDELLRRSGAAPSQKWIVKGYAYDDFHFDFEKLENVGPPIVEPDVPAQLVLDGSE